MITEDFWKGKKIFLTGHTGFKGAWLSLWLTQLGADVFGCSLPNEERKLYEQLGLENQINSTYGDICKYEFLLDTLSDVDPDIVIHMAAQSLVRKSYLEPLNTYATNVMGTVNILEASKVCSSLKAILIITTDKCYKNQESPLGYVESDPLGGHDPYSNSKACAEMVVDCYRDSFFTAELGLNKCLIASARAGNVIGGGDWADDRIVPDIIRSISSDNKITIRNPNAVRPWQHVLEPLAGYLMICQKLYNGERAAAQAWNFGPDSGNLISVERLVKESLEIWPSSFGYSVESSFQKELVETSLLMLDSTKAKNELGWRPLLDFHETLIWTIEWYKKLAEGRDPRVLTFAQINEYMTKT